MQLISQYTFDPGARQVTFTNVNPIDLSKVRSVANVTLNTGMYNGQPGASVNGNVLTLPYNTIPGRAKSTDVLNIYYGDPDPFVEPPPGGDLSVNSLLQKFDSTGEPLVIPHRGAGVFLAPENTLIAFQIGASYGLGVIDGGDWQTTKDGALACFHDAVTDGKTNKSRLVSDMSAPEVSQTIVTCSQWFSASFSDTKVLTADQLFAAFATSTVILPEPKDAAAAPILAGIIERMGIQPSVLPNAFNPDWLTPFLDVGCPHVLLNITTMPSPATRAGWLASGINWIGVPWDGVITPANVTTLANEGFRILVGTTYRAYQASGINNWLSVKDKIAAWASDDPLYFSHVLNAANASRYRRTSDPFATQTFYHGHLPGNGNDQGPLYRGEFRGLKRLGFQAGVARWVLCGWACPLPAPTSYALNYNVTVEAVGTDVTRWAGVFVGAPTDQGYSDAGNAWETGYMCYFRRNGQLVVLPKNAGVAGTALNASTQTVVVPLVTSAALAAGVPVTSIPVTALPVALSAGTMFRLPNDQVATVATGGAAVSATSVPVNSITPSAAVPSGSSLPQSIPLRIVVSPTQVVFSRQDSQSGSVTVTDSTTRGPYMFMGQSGGSAGYQASFSEMTVT